MDNAWIIKFEDADIADDVFVGEGAEEAARRAFQSRSMNWNCHLFAPIERLDETERDRQDMGMLIRRLLRRIPELGGAKGTIDNTQLIAQTKDYLVRKGLQGSVLREDA